MLGYQQIDLKELLKGAKFSHRFPNVKVSLSENLKICKLRHWYPGASNKKEDNEMEDDDNTEDDNDDNDNNDDIENDNDDDVNDDDKMDVDNMKGVDYKDYLYSNISKNISHTFLNVDGAVWNVFRILKITYGFLCIAKQVKLTNVDANELMIINQALSNNEHTKITEAMKNVPVDELVLLFLTNVDMQSLSIKMIENSALVSKNEFLAFYGYTYTNRAQFASVPTTEHRANFERIN
ncbi:hypothetical protein C1646_752991 [Rhizophagus diaphanus]|nr:hypothetical protein C1646_752991 [Rhizophagus diaphanus] [Rhizophagus sp. MUCL 43196]